MWFCAPRLSSSASRSPRLYPIPRRAAPVFPGTASPLVNAGSAVCQVGEIDMVLAPRKIRFDPLLGIGQEQAPEDVRAPPAAAGAAATCHAATASPRSARRRREFLRESRAQGAMESRRRWWQSRGSTQKGAEGAGVQLSAGTPAGLLVPERDQHQRGAARRADRRGRGAALGDARERGVCGRARHEASRQHRDLRPRGGGGARHRPRVAVLPRSSRAPRPLP
jgi:hypothetical protein